MKNETTRLGVKYKRVTIGDLSPGDEYMNSSWKSARFKKKNIDNKTCTIAWTWGKDNQDGELYNGIWITEKVWIKTI